jgi:kinesin family protein 4/21/27
VYEEDQGIVLRVMKDIFDKIVSSEANVTYTTKVQFLEVYGEEIRDLLDPVANGANQVQIRETENGEVQMAGAVEETVQTAEQMMQLLEKGTLSRTTGSTLMNVHSSRSHAVFTLMLKQEIKQPGGLDVEVRESKFHFVDLAGSERQKRTKSEGKRFKEGIDINKGLLALGNVISALGDDKKRGRVHVPYRDSKISRMLQDSLGGNSRTLMITCISPADVNFEESMTALKYANRARNIKNKPVVNIKGDQVVAELRGQVQLLQAEVLRLNGGDSGGASGAELMAELQANSGGKGSYAADPAMEQRCEVAESEVQRLSKALQQAKTQMAQMSETALLSRAEADFYKSKCGTADDSEKEQAEKQEAVGVIASYLRQIQELKESVRNNEAELDVARGPQSSAPADQQELIARARSDIAAAEAAIADAEHTEDADGDSAGAKDVEVEAMEAEAAESQRVFDQRQRNLSTTVKDLSTNISMKQELVDQLERSQAEHEKMKQFYEQKLSEMNEEVRTIQADRERLLGEVKVAEAGVKAGQKQTNLLKKLKEKDAELQKLQEKQRQYHEFMRIKERATQQMRELNTQIRNMKKQKVDLAQKLQQERKRMEEQAAARRLEVNRIKKALLKDRADMKLQQLSHEKQERVLRQRVAAITSENKRLQRNQLSGRAAGERGALSKQQYKSMDWLHEDIKKLTGTQRNADALRHAMTNRECTAREIESLYHKRNEFSSDVPNEETDQNLADVQERIEACQAQIEYQDDQINEMERAAERDEAGEAQVFRKLEVTSLPQAHEMLKNLLKSLVESKKVEQEKAEQSSALELRLAEANEERHETEHALQHARMNFDRQLTTMQKDHEIKLSSYIEHYDATAQSNTAQDVVSDSSSPTKKELMLQMAAEKEEVMRRQIEQLQASRGALERKVRDLMQERRRVGSVLEEKRTHIEWLQFELQGTRQKIQKHEQTATGAKSTAGVSSLSLNVAAPAAGEQKMQVPESPSADQVPTYPVSLWEGDKPSTNNDLDGASGQVQNQERLFQTASPVKIGGEGADAVAGTPPAEMQHSSPARAQQPGYVGIHHAKQAQREAWGASGGAHAPPAADVNLPVESVAGDSAEERRPDEDLACVSVEEDTPANDVFSRLASGSTRSQRERLKENHQQIQSIAQAQRSARPAFRPSSSSGSASVQRTKEGIRRFSAASSAFFNPEDDPDGKKTDSDVCTDQTQPQQASVPPMPPTEIPPAIYAGDDAAAGDLGKVGLHQLLSRVDEAIRAGREKGEIEALKTAKAKAARAKHTRASSSAAELGSPAGTSDPGRANVFSRLTDKKKFTGIHRQHEESMARAEAAQPPPGHTTRRRSFSGSVEVSPQVAPSAGDKADVFSRLANPSSFTGTHRAKEKEKASEPERGKDKVVKAKAEEDVEAVPALGGDGGVFARLANPASFTGTQVLSTLSDVHVLPSF